MRAGLLTATILGSLILLAVGLFSTREAAGPESEQGRPSRVRTAEVGLAVDPRDESLLKATAGGLFRSTDGGRVWTAVPLPLRVARTGIGQVVINPGDPTIIYAAGTGTGVIVSRDGGASWRPARAGPPSMPVVALAIHAFRRETLFASVQGKGIYRTEDGGQRWQRMDGGPDNRAVLALAHSPLEGSMNTGWLYAGTRAGPYLSMDCF